MTIRMRLLTAILFLSITASCQRGIDLPGGWQIVKVSGAPIVDAGSNQAVTTSSATLSGTASDPDGSIVSVSWGQVSGPNTAAITSPTSYTTAITGLLSGAYTFRFTAVDNNGKSSTSYINVVVTMSVSDTLYLYVSAGQSNMDGRAVDSFPYADVQNRVIGVMVWDWKTTRTFQTFEYDRYNGGQTMSTPKWAGDIIVMRKLRDSVMGGGIEDTTWLMKATLGGSSLAPANTVGNWIIPQDSSYPGKPKMFDTLKNRLNDIRAWAAARGKYVKVKALMWHQGEDDYISGRDIPYQYRLERLFSAIRTEVGNPTLPIVMGNISSSVVNGYSALVRAAHENVSSADPFIYLVDMEGQPLQADNIHFTGAAQWYFGNEIFKIIKSL